MNLVNCRLKKIGRRGKIDIWLVDGSKIRKNLEKEFTNFGQHFRFPFIPEYELWIDQEAVPNERKFFIDHLLVEWQLMRKGVHYLIALEAGEEKERSEREKAGDPKKVFGKDGSADWDKIHQKLLAKTRNGLSVWLVNGRLVRSCFYISFTEGGHDLVYKFIPKNEIWLDNDLLPKEIPYVFLHELYERGQMSQGLDYATAHKKASRREWQARNKAKLLTINDLI